MAKLDPLNTSRYWHAPDLPGMDLLHADFRTHEYAPHVHYSFVIAVTEAGGSEFTSRGRTGIAQPRSLLVFNGEAGFYAQALRARCPALAVHATTELALSLLLSGRCGHQAPDELAGSGPDSLLRIEHAR